jgi:hypothetical protein
LTDFDLIREPSRDFRLENDAAGPDIALVDDDLRLVEARMFPCTIGFMWIIQAPLARPVPSFRCAFGLTKINSLYYQFSK